MSTIRLLHCLYLNTALFVLGLLGVILNRKSILVTLMSIELILLSVSLNFITGSVFFNEVIGSGVCDCFSYYNFNLQIS
jgi:NADH-quinone oxidoreductase subunit K